MSAGIPSLQYMRLIANAIIVYDMKFVRPQREGLGVDTDRMHADWDAIVDLAKEMEALASPKKAKRKSRGSVPSAGDSGTPVEQA